MKKTHVRPIASTDEYLLEQITDIIDVRSPGEFLEDHIPGAINIPVLDNDQRAEVGTLYKNDSFAAKKLGAALISENISQAIQTTLKDKSIDFVPLIYCARGGQRSLSMATVLAQIGWHCHLLNGGYKHYRSLVRVALQDTLGPFQLCMVNGLTGTAKTRVLHFLAEMNEQVLDLEGLANHRGSLLGANPDSPQPSQKLFETRVADHCRKFNPQQRIWVESESNKIGNLHIPEKIWKQMRSAPQIEINAPVEARVTYILQDYQALTRSAEQLKRKLGYIKHRIATELFTQWTGHIDHQRWPQLVESLLSEHYDPSYRRSMANNQRETIASIDLIALSDSELTRAASVLSNL